jgi:hypothetical protein
LSSRRSAGVCTTAIGHLLDAGETVILEKCTVTDKGEVGVTNGPGL